MIVVPAVAVLALANIPRLASMPSGLPDGNQSPSAEAAPCVETGLGVEQGLTPDGIRVVRCVKAQFPQLQSFGGVGDRPSNVDDDHQTGRAVDIMIPGRCDELGNQVTDYVYAHQKQLGVKYIIWCDQIWSVARSREGWRPYRNPNGADDTLAHRDHVHVSVFGDAAEGSTVTVAPATRLPGEPPPPQPPAPGGSATATPARTATPTPTPTATPTSSPSPGTSTASPTVSPPGRSPTARPTL